MKKVTLLLLSLLGLYQAQAQRVCGSSDHYHKTNQMPDVLANREAIEKMTANYIAKGGKKERAIVTIPVVVHVLYDNATANISDAQIASQIAVLNSDFARTNADYANLPSAFASIGGIPDIQFCMAQRDPSGNATTGIIRKSTTKTAFDANTDDAKSATTGDAAWNASNYLNLWVVPSLKAGTTTGILGYAQFPGGPASTDGVVIAHSYFGTTGTAVAPFNKGRTGTHEVGHWLNLFHIWGDDNGACTGSDQSNDTPNQGAENYGTPAFPHVSCSNGPNGDLFMNYMDYTDDAAMYMFTAGQVARMQALFATGGSRASLKTSLGCQAPNTTACNAPNALGSASISQTGATLSWAAATNATSYTLQYKTSAAAAFTSVTVTGTSYTLTGLTAATAYNWQVSSTCASGTSAYTAATFTTANVASTCTDNYEPNASRTAAVAMPVNTNITAFIGTSTDVDWYKFSNTTATKNIQVDLTNLPADYDLKLYRSSTLIGTSQNGGTTAEQLKYNNGTVTTYYANVYGYSGAFSATSCYRLRASLSATTFRVNGNTNNADVEENINAEKINGNLDITVYPNPTANAFSIDIVNLQPTINSGCIKIVDITGKAVYTASQELRMGVNSHNVNATLPAGLYQVIVNVGQEVKVQKLIIQQ